MDVLVCVQVYKEGNWSPVFVDDRIPCNVLGKPAYSTSRSELLNIYIYIYIYIDVDVDISATWQDGRPHLHTVNRGSPLASLPHLCAPVTFPCCPPLELSRLLSR
jgi:hypothetical protein